jgi:predicted Zn-dependent peptidase
MNKVLDRSKIPAPVQPGPFYFPEFERFQLANGLSVVIARQSKLPLVSINLCVKTACLLDPPQKEGLANLTAELLAEGTEQRTSTEIANEFEFIAAYFGVGVDWNAVNIELNTLTKHLDKAMDIYADVVLNPIFPDKELQRVRQELLTERLRAIDSPAKISNERFIQILYGGFRYGLPVEGTEKSLQNITKEDVLSFYKNVFIPNNSTLIIVGDVAKAEAEKLVDKYFSKWTAAEVPQLPQLKYEAPQKTKISLIHKPGAAQSELRIGHLGIDRKNPDFYAVTLMNEILGGYFLSRINMNLREDRGYTYGASSIFSYRKLTGPFFTAAAVQTKYTSESISEIIKELKSICASSVTDEEIRSAKGYLIGIFPVAFETADQIGAGLTNIVVFDLPDDYYRTYRDKINSITNEDILRAAKKYIHPEHLHIIVTADRNDVEDKLKEIYDVIMYDVNGKRLAYK